MILTGPNQVAYGRLAALKGALKLEKVGMKTRGGALRPKLAKEFGLKPRDSYDMFIQHCLDKMEELIQLKAQGAV